MKVSADASKLEDVPGLDMHENLLQELGNGKDSMCYDCWPVFDC